MPCWIKGIDITIVKDKLLRSLCSDFYTYLENKETLFFLCYLKYNLICPVE